MTKSIIRARKKPEFRPRRLRCRTTQGREYLDPKNHAPCGYVSPEAPTESSREKLSKISLRSCSLGTGSGDNPEM